MTKYQLGLILALVGSTVSPSPAQAGLDEKSKVLAEWLVNFTIETLPDLTTAPQRATIPNTFQWLDALAIAPAEPADWTPLTKVVPGVLIKGTLKEDHIKGTLKEDQQGRFLLRLPKEWNGKLVVAGAAGTRTDGNHLVRMPWGYRTVVTRCARPSKTTRRLSMGASSGRGSATVRTSLGNYRLA